MCHKLFLHLINLKTSLSESTFLILNGSFQLFLTIFFFTRAFICCSLPVDIHGDNIRETTDLISFRCVFRCDRTGRIGHTPVTVFDKSVRRNDATGSDAKQNAFCFHLWCVRVRRPLYRRGTSVTRTLVEPAGSGRCLTLFPSARPVSDAFV